MKTVIKNISKEWKFFYTVILIGIVAIVAINVTKQYFQYSELLIQVLLLIWYVLIIANVIYITVKRFNGWEKSVFTYGGENAGFVEIEQEIDVLREDKSKEEIVYQKVNEVYEDLNASLSDALERQNYIRNRLRFTGEILQLILNIGIAVIIGILPELNNVAGNNSVVLHIIVSFFVAFMCIITFPTSIIDPEYSKVQAVYEYEEKRLEKELYRRQKEM